MAKPVARVRPSTCFIIAFFSVFYISSAISADEEDEKTSWSFSGHSKFQYIHTLIPGDSVLQEISGDNLQDYNLEVRFKAKAKRARWDFDAHLQLIAVNSDRLSAADVLPVLIFPGSGVINDDRRWFDLTHMFHYEGSDARLARLDRASIGFTGDSTVIRFGRQAVSWGNGLLYTPMDIFNPFDPTAVDKEYKSGDDMLYGQYLLSNGSDIQAVAVVRRDLLSGEVEADKSSMAVKYHGFVGGKEYDLLLAEHYDDRVIGVGGSADVFGAVWRGDLVWTDTPTDSVFSAVAGASYSWIAAEHNWTGALEYYYNGFGQRHGDYTAADLAQNPDLLKRLSRGEVFNLGRHYLGASMTVEMTPLLLLSPNVFINLTDPSALAQLVMTWDWKQDLQVLAALNLPIGPNGSEYGGIVSHQPDRYFSTGASVFAQLAWYF